MQATKPVHCEDRRVERTNRGTQVGVCSTRLNKCSCIRVIFLQRRLVRIGNNFRDLSLQRRQLLGAEDSRQPAQWHKLALLQSNHISASCSQMSIWRQASLGHGGTSWHAHLTKPCVAYLALSSAVTVYTESTLSTGMHVDPFRETKRGGADLNVYDRTFETFRDA